MDAEIPAEEFVTDLVKRLARRLETHSDNYLRQSAGMSLEEWQLLVHIYQFHNQRLAKISDEISVDLADLVMSFDSLEKLGYAFLDKDDLTVKTTPDGRNAYLSVLPLMQNRQKALLTNLAPEERAALRALLLKMLDRVTGMLEEQPESAGKWKRRGHPQLGVQEGPQEGPHEGS